MRRAIAGLLLGLWIPTAVRAEPVERRQPPPVADGAPHGVLNLNQASPEQLELLPGIGPVKARQIVEHRRLHPFRHIEEIMRVKGIGRRTFGRLRSYLAVNGETTVVKRVRGE
jgi:competence protein ComEA